MACRKSNVDEPIYNITKTVVDDSAMVVTAHPEATRIGLEILRAGGNAVDASIAVQMALAVCYPVAGNIGGGGFMIYRDNAGNAYSLDYREKAPGAAFPDMYLDSLGNPIDKLSTKGHLAAGVPGTVDGMYRAYQRFSKLKDWKKLIQPAIDLAEKGYKVTERQAKAYNRYQEDFKKYNTQDHAFTGEWKKGQLLIQGDLAETLKRVRDGGRDGFYSGKTAELLVAEMNRGNGVITLEDLQNYESKWREPVKTTYRGHTVISMPPPSSGGVALSQLLSMVEPYDLREMGFQSPESVHLIVEAERRVYADRATYLGDPDFFSVPIDTLTSKYYTASRMANFDKEQASISDSTEAGVIESEETTHYSILDPYGNAVSMTTTLNGGFGSTTIVGGGGFFLNNEMDDFSIKPGVPNMFGLIGAEANKVEAGKRMLSSMTPSIVEKDGSLYIVVGTPGGSTIITSVFQTIINIIDYDMNASEAVQAPRFHHQWLPDMIFHEDDALSEETKKILTDMGHKLSQRGKIGKVEAILISGGGKTVEGAADIRADDDAKGF